MKRRMGGNLKKSEGKHGEPKRGNANRTGHRWGGFGGGRRSDS